MSEFNKPRGGPEIIRRPRFRERTYPYILKSSSPVSCDGQCEACDKPAKFSVMYESSKTAVDVSIIFLCSDHEKLTRYGKWDQVFRDMDRKCDKGAK